MLARRPAGAADRRRSGRTRSSGTACGCSPTSATAGAALLAHRDATSPSRFPELAGLAERAPRRAAGRRGRRDGRTAGRRFEALAERMHVQDRRARARAGRAVAGDVLVFDIAPAVRRRPARPPAGGAPATLERLELAGALAGATGYDDGPALPAATLEQGLEGVVSKRRSPPYQPGRRSPDWVKMRHRSTQTCLVGGWRPQTGTTRGSARCWSGLPDGDGRALVFIGRVGSGMTGAIRGRPERLLRRCSPADAPFADSCPGLDAAARSGSSRRSCVEVRVPGHGSAGRLRQPVLRGLRRPTSGRPRGAATVSPLNADSVRVEGGRPRAELSNLRQGALPGDRDDEGRGARLLRPGRRRDAAAHRRRPVTRKRWPDGVAASPSSRRTCRCGTPDWVDRDVADTGLHGGAARASSSRWSRTWPR